MRTILGSLLGAAAILLAGCGWSTTRQPPIFVFPDMRFQGRYDPQMERPLRRPPLQPRSGCRNGSSWHAEGRRRLLHGP